MINFSLDMDSQFLQFSDDLDQFVQYKRKNRDKYFQNCNNIINGYHSLCQQQERKNINSLNSLLLSLNKLDFSSDNYIDLSKIKKVLIDFNQIYKDSFTNDINLYSDLNEVFKNTQNIIKENLEENRLYSSHFNALKFFNIDEPLHSRLLVKLLNPNSEHGQGKLFLLEFLKLLEVESPEEGHWKTTAEVGRIDILLKRSHPESVIIIENKSNHAIDQQNQLYRYWHQEIYVKTKEVDSNFYIKNRSKYKIIYMPPDLFKYPDIQSIYKPNDENWSKRKELPDIMPIDYEIRPFNEFVVQWIINCIEALPKNNNRMSEYLKQYKEICFNL